MHFSKTYAQLLLTLPPELRDNAIEYRQLKKLINQVVNELASLGLRPSLLQQLLEQRENGEKLDLDGLVIPGLRASDAELVPEVTYELLPGANSAEPQLRLRLRKRTNGSNGSSQVDLTQTKLRSLQDHTGESDDGSVADLHSSILSPNLSIGKELADGPQELVIPLLSDTAFFHLLSTALRSLSSHLANVHANFIHTLESLSKEISLTARPASSSSSFQPHSTASDASSVNISSPLFSTSVKTDLYAWREIFQLYVEAEVFESVHEMDRGERSVEQSETRLRAFADRVTQRGLTKRLTLKQSKGALEMFLDLNMFILNVKKFQIANAEATRKILKKHTKRTALPLPEMSLVNGAGINQETEFALIPQTSTSLPRILVQAIGETLLPIIPHVDDYSCLICTSIAFKPIRLFCGHLFCVRCLVKMQKRGQDHCPMCRAPTVLKADRSNVDWALLNFMQDWFPVEAKAKLKNNEKEAGQEQLQELGLDNHGCIIV